MVLIYKRDDERYANDTSVDFLKNWDIRIDWAEYWTCIREFQSHDDELAFSIRKEDFPKLIKAIKSDKFFMWPHKRKCKELLSDIWNDLTKEQIEVFMWLETRFSEELWYRHIYDLCEDAWIEPYDFQAYL